MIQDKMLAEIQELKLSGYTLQEVYDLLKSRHTKVPTIKTVRKYYNMNDAPDDNHSKLKKPLAFDVEPFKETIIEVMANNPRCKMSSVYDVLIEK